MASKRDNLNQLLRDRGITPTQQRLEIAELLFSRRQHLSADQVLGRINAAGGNVSKATVYNTLGLFADKGLIRTVIADSTRVFYDSNTRPHHHFYDIDTGQLTDMEMDDVQLHQLPDVPAGREVEGVDIIVRLRAVLPSERD